MNLFLGTNLCTCSYQQIMDLLIPFNTIKLIPINLYPFLQLRNTARTRSQGGANNFLLTSRLSQNKTCVFRKAWKHTQWELINIQTW